MKCFRILPEIWARTLRFPGNSTRNIVPGNTCVTVPSVTICSSFGTPNGKQNRDISQPLGCQDLEKTNVSFPCGRAFGLDFSLRLAGVWQREMGGPGAQSACNVADPDFHRGHLFRRSVAAETEAARHTSDLARLLSRASSASKSTGN